MKDNPPPNYNSAAVRDLNVASFLKASGEVRLVNVERQDGTVYFHFDPKQLTEALISSYWSETAKPLQAKRLLDSLRDLKDILFSGGSG